MSKLTTPIVWVRPVPVVAGRHRVAWEVAGNLTGRAHAVARGGAIPRRTFAVTDKCLSGIPEDSRVRRGKHLSADVHGATFDRWYTSLEVLDHEQDIQETSDEIAMGTNSAVVANARQELPMLKMHLKLSRAA